MKEVLVDNGVFARTNNDIVQMRAQAECSYKKEKMVKRILCYSNQFQRCFLQVSWF